MKKLTVLSFLIVLLASGLHFTKNLLQHTSGTAEPDIFHLYNWGDYIDPELLSRFEKETGYQVIYETFDSNEAMYTKVEQGGTGYDLVIPSEYMIARMIKEDLVLPLDHEKINGFENIDGAFMDLSFDRGNQYSIPYFWGTLGIAYNENMVKDAPMTWEDLFDSEYRNSILMIDGAREVLGIGLQATGHSLNSKDRNELDAAADKLTDLAPNIKALVADEIKMYMIQEEAGLAVTYSGEAADMIWENEDIHYILPEEGSNLWFDNMVIPYTVKNKEAAYAFINFMLVPEVAAQNADYIGYSTPNKAAMAYFAEETIEDEQFYPDQSTLEKLEVYEDLGQEFIGLYNDLFLKFKTLK
ncbi:ABC transporter substrate-binding protein [Alkalibacterium kapii]|uniref:Spermidine/putrescine ABC transporter substrate-binding protein n=1 Tax=Alkalibacterium kapii TaxID=426704 RepID=A0A511ATV3_9LACT|nr:ABC transporter substrate-binding protein [Alkalibacterium kapii]GEK90511.1 spermidine/putrescine ABC transporter substrate-binding protein [Alkalibacterium kapii]